MLAMLLSGCVAKRSERRAKPEEAFGYFGLEMRRA
jgi:hypothetical protein